MTILSSQVLRILIAGAVLSAGLSGQAFAGSGQLAAKLAITRAQANIDMVSKENPAATGERSFAQAQAKLAEANVAIGRDDNRQAEWLANEAEMLADTTAGNAKLAGLEQTRTAVAHDVNILEVELRK
jgi:hypothetical protein